MFHFQITRTDLAQIKNVYASAVNIRRQEALLCFPVVRLARPFVVRPLTSVSRAAISL